MRKPLDKINKVCYNKHVIKGSDQTARKVKKNSTERKPTAKQIENEGFKSDILAYMEPNVLYAAGDILKNVPSIVDADMSINRVSALMTQLKEAGAVTVTVEKRKNFYALAV